MSSSRTQTSFVDFLRRLLSGKLSICGMCYYEIVNGVPVLRDEDCSGRCECGDPPDASVKELADQKRFLIETKEARGPVLPFWCLPSPDRPVEGLYEITLWQQRMIRLMRVTVGVATLVTLGVGLLIGVVIGLAI